MQLSVILVEPSVAGNVGAVARLMANFGVEDLILVNPKCDHLCKEAMDRAKHARLLLKKARVADWAVLKEYDSVIATTARIGTEFNMPRVPIRPDELGEKLAAAGKGSVALVFGREGPGLSNEEILQCDFSVTIPTNKKYPSLNLSHAVAIALYEIHAALAKVHITSHIRQASQREKEQTMKLLEQTLQLLEFRDENKRETQRRLWKRLVSKSFLTSREAAALMGYLRRVLEKRAL
ncbi:TrmJ/YjtD family RNA methyltransferase [Candidatus Woesearchaeota archaeon]|nr:TrmJ/YjtD family RNA methyltransferase [Candidatus Woesearchaeota archaeon]